MKPILAFVSLLLFSGVLSPNASAQPLRAPDYARTKPTEIGKILMVDKIDFREHFFDKAPLLERIKKGVISVARSNFDTDGKVRDYSTNQWVTVSDALKELKLLDRTRRTPQIRVIQKDAILQSSILLGNTISGFDQFFLERRLDAGDLIIITMISD